jgi:TPR repeat protein
MHCPLLPPFPSSLQELACLLPAQWQAVVASEPVAAAQWMQGGAQLGNADAQITLGQWLLDGHGVQRNPAEALVWFMKAAQQGHPMGMNMTGRCFENGWGTDADYFIAANWYRQAAHKGLDAGMYNLANLLATGKGVALDHATALAWYRQAAQQGHAKSKTKIGRYYEVGLVVEKDMDAAFKCFEDGAKGGDFRGQFNYAGMLAARGQFDEALVWLRKVPLTATPGYQREVGPLLLQSPHAAFRAVGQTMLDRIATPAAS